jgi:hypothetical protein
MYTTRHRSRVVSNESVEWWLKLKSRVKTESHNGFHLFESDVPKGFRIKVYWKETDESGGSESDGSDGSDGNSPGRSQPKVTLESLSSKVDQLGEKQHQDYNHLKGDVNEVKRMMKEQYNAWKQVITCI